jgi:hypothetical protein
MHLTGDLFLAIAAFQQLVRLTAKLANEEAIDSSANPLQ